MTCRKSPNRTVLACALSLALCAPYAVLAQDAQTEESTEQKAQDEASDSKSKTLDTVTVTGSRIKRAEIEGPSPVTVITSEQIKKEGFATVYDALLTLTENLGGVQNDYDWGQSSVNASPLNLRALGPGRTLLMINGHRVTDYPMPYQGQSNFANFNNIPTGIVERIEVLTGAASAIYGSDAMGGVVNVILKEHADEQQLRVRLGTTTRGGRDDADIVFSGGASGDRWNAVYNLQHFDRSEFLAKERPFMDAEDDRDYATWGVAERALGIAKLTPYPGIRVRQPGSVESVPGVGGVTRTVAPPAGACEQYGELFYTFQYMGYDLATSQPYASASTICAQRVFQNWALRTGSKDDSGYLRGTYDFTDSLQGWASVGVWSSTGKFNSFLDGFGSGAYWDPRATNLETGATGGAPREILKFISPEEMGGQADILTLSKELATDISVGLKGTLADRFDWEASLGRADYEVKESFPTLNQGDMFDFFMGPQLGTVDGLPVYTPDYDKVWNPLTPGEVDVFSRRGEKKAESWLTQAQFVLSGDLFEGWAGPIGFAAVLEAAKQGYKLTPDPKTLECDADCWYTPFGNIEQGGGERNRYAAGLELRAPLLEESSPLGSLTADVAGRYDKYDAVRDGAKTTWQAGMEWRPFKSLLVRGTFGTTFRAPDMHYVYAKPSSGISDATDYVACSNDPNRVENFCSRDTYKIEDATVNFGGTPNLKYEEGEGTTVGLVWDAFKNFSTSLDYWKVTINNEIRPTSIDELLYYEAVCAKPGWTPDGATLANPPTSEWCELASERIIRNGPANVAGNVIINTQPINRAEKQVSGFDYTARYALPETRIGSFNFGLNYTYMLTYKERNLPTEKLVDNQKYQTRSKITASVNWNWEKWNATLMMYQKSGGRDNRWGGCLPFEDGTVPSTRVNDEICREDNEDNVHFGETTARHYARREPRRYFNGSVGYAFTDDIKLNLYVNNIFDKIYGDKWCGDFAYCIDDPTGRDVALEIVYKIK